MRISTFAGVLAFAITLSPNVFAGSVKLKAVRFPTSITGEGGTTTPPGSAPVSQRIVFEFTGTPEIGPGIAQGLKIRVADTNNGGQPIGLVAYGTYEVKGNKVIFSARLPKTAVNNGFSTTSDVAGNAALPGLLPNTEYEIDATIGEPNSVLNLKKVTTGAGLPLKFTTTGVLADFFSNASSDPVKAKKGKVKPVSGTKGLAPSVYADPAGLFGGIKASKRPPISVQFNGPLNTHPANFTRNYLRLRAVETPAGAPESEVLGGTMVLVENTPKKSKILLYPTGNLPLGHKLVLELSSKLLALSFAQQGAGQPETFQKLATYTVAKDPNPGTAVDEFLEETFDNVVRQDTSIAAEGQQLASWDSSNNNVLKSSFGFGGDGELGRFSPPTGDSVTIFLDTDFQAFPLFSGATPEAQPGTVVLGGVFNFTDFDLPPNAKIISRGTNPLIITCTGYATIEGVIDLNGANGQSDDTFDSAMTPMPGGSPGAGGGRGGDAHPVFVPPGATSLVFIQTPAFGESGYAPGNLVPGGGGGGQCGCSLPWSAFSGGNCSSYSPAGDGSRGSGGGGGSFNVFLPNGPEPTNVPVSGRRGAIGIGNHLPVPFAPSEEIPPAPFAYQATPGNPTNAVAMANPNLTFREAWLSGMVYDTGSNFNISTNWAVSKRVLMFGEAGPAVFVDGSDENDFIGPGGELAAIQGGQGGGGAGTRTEGLDQKCKQAIFLNAQLPFTVLDARGGGGGGGAGALLMQALGVLEIRGANASIEAQGGHGGGGEGTQSSSRGGAGGGGSGGAIILQSATNVVMNNSLPSVAIDVSGGCGANAINLSNNANYGTPGADTGVLQFADGGPGGPGIVQIHVPEGAPDMVDESAVNAWVFKTVNQVSSSQSIQCAGTGSPPFTGQSAFNPLVDSSKTPTPLTPRSVARSTWYDLGAVTGEFRPPVITSAGPIDGPVFGVPGVGPFFRGTDVNSGLVTTDTNGFVLDPFNNDIEVDSPDLLRSDYIPNGESDPHFQSVEVFFQGANESGPFPGTPDSATETAWVSDITLLNGFQFIRWELQFDIATNVAQPPQPSTPRLQVNRLRIPLKY